MGKTMNIKVYSSCSIGTVSETTQYVSLPSFSPSNSPWRDSVGSSLEKKAGTATSELYKAIEATFDSIKEYAESDSGNPNRVAYQSRAIEIESYKVNI